IESPVSMELFGSVNGRQVIEVSLADITVAAVFSYLLDCRPYGIDNGEDLKLNGSEPSDVLLELGGFKRQNQSAWLIVESFDELGDLLHTELRQVLLFNQ